MTSRRSFVSITSAHSNEPQLSLDLSPSNPAFPAACTALGSVGFAFQAMHGFSLPFPLNILLLPFRIMEWALFYMLSYGPQ